MTNLTYNKDLTGPLVIDPYDDFISEGGKVWDRLKNVAEANQCVPHMLQVRNAARKAGLRVFYALHRRYRPGDCETWKYIAPVQKAAWSRKIFENGTWLQWFRQHGFGFAAQETRHPSAHHHGTHSTHLYGGNCR